MLDEPLVCPPDGSGAISTSDVKVGLSSARNLGERQMDRSKRQRSWEESETEQGAGCISSKTSLP